ncbi:MAG TPA: hypothetical protein VKD71_06505, partial [Gemmataceae bacterium]|nr:hypothetical protein [Gemmataceae bacterium]
MRRRALFLIISLLMPACTTVTLVEPKPTSIGSAYIVEPQIRWASVPSRPGMDVWTVDGSALDAITFVKGVSDGEVLLRGAIPGGAPDDKRPRFRGHMTPSGIVGLVADRYALFGHQKIETS